MERVRHVGLRHGDGGRAKQFERFKTRSGAAERGVLEIRDAFDGRAAHDDAGRAGESGKNLCFSEFRRIFLLEKSRETMAGGLGVREEMRQIRRFGDRETAGLVAHGEIADGGGAVRDAVVDGFRAKQCSARIGLDADTVVRAAFHFLFPAFHLDAGEGFRRREVRVAEFDDFFPFFAGAADQKKKHGGDEEEMFCFHGCGLVGLCVHFFRENGSLRTEDAVESCCHDLKKLSNLIFQW